jgi:hypothetical protein
MFTCGVLINIWHRQWHPHKGLPCPAQATTRQGGGRIARSMIRLVSRNHGLTQKRLYLWTMENPSIALASSQQTEVYARCELIHSDKA